MSLVFVVFDPNSKLINNFPVLWRAPGQLQRPFLCVLIRGCIVTPGASPGVLNLALDADVSSGRFPLHERKLQQATPGGTLNPFRSTGPSPGKRPL